MIKNTQKRSTFLRSTFLKSIVLNSSLTLFLGFTLCVFSLTPLIAKADFGYGNVKSYFPSGAIVNYGSLDDNHNYECITTTMVCSLVLDRTIPIEFSVSDGSKVFYNKDASLAAVVRRGVVNDVTRTNRETDTNIATLNVYKISRTDTEIKTENSVQIPLSKMPSIMPTKIIWSPDDTVLVVVYSGKSYFIDVVNSKILYSRNFVPNGSFLTLSPSARYFASYYPATNNNKHIRTFSVYDSLTGKYYSSKNNIGNYWDLLSEENTVFAFSADEKYLIFLNDIDGHSRPYLVDLSALPHSGLKPKILISKQYEVGPIIFTGPTEITYMATRDSALSWGLWRYDFKTKNISKLAENPSYSHSFRSLPDGLLFFQINGDHSEPVFFNEKQNKLLKFSGLPGTDSSVAEILARQEISVTGNSAAIVRLPGPLVRPQGPQPLLIWLHGGPYRQTLAGYHPYQSYGVYDWLLDQVALSGALVVKMNYPGSFGTGRFYAESLRGTVGVSDVAAVRDVIDYMQKNYTLGEVYLMGNSYGGYLALRAQVEMPEKVLGAISINGVTDWQTLLTNLRTSIFNTQFYGAPSSSNSKYYKKASILSRIGNLYSSIQTSNQTNIQNNNLNNKTLILQSKADRTISPSQAPLIYNALIAAGKNAELHYYEGEDHVFAKPSSMEDMCQRVFNMVGLPTQERCDFK